MTSKPSLRFATIGLNHQHIYGQTVALLDAGAELVAVHADEDDLAAAYVKRFPQARRVADRRAILEDQSIAMIVSATIPDTRAATDARRGLCCGIRRRICRSAPCPGCVRSSARAGTADGIDRDADRRSEHEHRQHQLVQPRRSGHQGRDRHHEE